MIIDETKGFIVKNTNQLTSDQMVIWNALKQAAGYDDKELKKAVQDHYEYGTGVYSQLSHTAVALEFFCNIDVLTSEFFQDELRLVTEQCYPDMAVELLQAQANLLRLVKNGYDLEEACSHLTVEYMTPKDINNFMIGFVGSFYMWAFEQEDEDVA